MTGSRTRLVPFVLALVIASLAASVHAQEDEIPWHGPFRLRGQFPLDLPTLDLTPDDARLLPSGAITMETFLAHSNTFELSPSYDERAAYFEAGAFPPGWDYEVDSESTRLTVRVDFGIGDRLQLGVEVPVISHQGGFMDGSIESFHERTDLPNGDREERPQGEFGVDLISGNRRSTFDESQVAFSDVSLHAKVALLHSRGSALSAIVDVKGPTGDEDALAGGGDWDYGVGIIGSVGGERNAFHGGIARYFLGTSKWLPFEAEDRTSVYAAYELAIAREWSFGLQLLGATSILLDERVLEADEERVEVSFGARHASGPFEVTFGFTENLTVNDNNIDLGLFVGGIWSIRSGR